MLLSEHPEQPKDWRDLRILFIGGYWMGGDDDVVRVFLRNLVDLGAQVHEFCTDSNRDALDLNGRPYDYGRFGPVYLRDQALAPVIRQCEPHAIVCCAGGLSFTPPMAAALRLRHCLIGMAISDPDVFEPSTRYIAANFDVFSTNSLKAAYLYRRIGVDAVWRPLACDPKYHRRQEPSAEYACDVMFIGEARAERLPLVRAMMDAFHTRVFGRGWDGAGIPNGGVLPGNRFGTAVSSARICLDFARNLAGDYMVKSRVFEFAACGSVACTEIFPELAIHFRYGEEILGYSGETELVPTIKECLSQPDERDRMAAKAHSRALAEHTFAHRWQKLMLHCGMYGLQV